MKLSGICEGPGITWALYMLFAGWISILGWGTSFVELMSTVYIGFGPSLSGGIIGAVWGLIAGAIAGAVIALVYNFAVRKKMTAARIIRIEGKAP